MSFNFDNFMSAMAKILPAVGETVIALHPGNAAEAIKIQAGTALIQAIASSLHQSATAEPAAPVPQGPFLQSETIDNPAVALVGNGQ